MWRNVAVGSISPVIRHYVRRGFAASAVPFDNQIPLLHTDDGMGRYGWTHFGVMIPSLPDPHRYLSLMVMAGETGLRAFDVPGEADRDHPVDPVTVATSTGMDGAHRREVLSSERECSYSRDDIRFGDIASISGEFPDFDVAIRIADRLDVALRMTCRPEATWFIRSPIYDHFGFMASYEGTVRDGDGNAVEIEGIGNRSSGRCTPTTRPIGAPSAPRCR